MRHETKIISSNPEDILQESLKIENSSEEILDNRKNTAESLISELNVLKAGKDSSPDYEKLMSKIVSFLFKEYLFSYKEQRWTNDKLYRYDIVARINPHGNTFWNFVVSELKSRYVIFECKNYKDKIQQGEILTTERYLYKSALRTFAIIFTRQGVSENGRKVIEGAIREQGKVMLVLDDEDVRKMLNSDDPSDILFDLIDDLLMSLNR